MIAPATAHFPTTVQSAMFRRGNNNLVSFPLHHRQKEKQQFELPLGSARLDAAQLLFPARRGAAALFSDS